MSLFQHNQKSTQEAKQDSDNEIEQMFEVEFICSVRYNYNTGKMEYFAKFKNYHISKNWWIDDISDCKEAAIQFWEQIEIQTLMKANNSNKPKRCKNDE